MVVVLVVVAVSVAALAAAGYVGYKYGQKVEAEYTVIYQAAHRRVSTTLDAVKAEVAKIEAEEKANAVVGRALDVVSRIKALL